MVSVGITVSGGGEDQDVTLAISWIRYIDISSFVFSTDPKNKVHCIAALQLELTN